MSSGDIMEGNSMEAMLDIMKDEDVTWAERKDAAIALKELCVDRKNCDKFVDIKGETYLQWLLIQSIEKVPMDILITAVDMFVLLGGYPELRMQLVDLELADALCNSFEIEDRAGDELKITCCKALSSFCLEKRFMELCLFRNLIKILYGLLTDVESVSVAAAVTVLVQQLCADNKIAEQFVEAGYLNYMLKNRCNMAMIPTWNTCIDALLSVDLSIKFDTIGRLSMHDVTRDGFYAMRRHTCPFPALDEIFRLKVCPIKPVYVINFAKPYCNETDVDKDLSFLENENSSAESLNPWLEVNFGKLQFDSNLYECLQVFKSILAAEERRKIDTEERQKLINKSKIAVRAKLLGRFVVRQMPGNDLREPCTDHHLHIHICKIREAIKTSVIPLGQLHVGGYFERALLFKVIADRICLPASLIRGECGKAWIEIAIPQVENCVYNADSSSTSNEILKQNINESKISLLSARKKSVKSQKTTSLPTIQKEETIRSHDSNESLRRETVSLTKLQPQNYVVDLMENPGDLIPVDSDRARAYCAPETDSLLD